MSSCNFYQAEKKDVEEIYSLLKQFKSDLIDLDYPDINETKVRSFINLMLQRGKIICVKNLDTNKLIGVCIFCKSNYWWSDQETMIIQLIYVVKEFRNYKLMKQLIDSVKQVSNNNPILLSITSKLEADKLFEKLGFENMGSNWRLK
jgi:N-acetylglutamate synthase-like GNAT family acetyltransferase|tara:strand:+ start:751 stop:1191 length:441 start_codon:yes stop_codon:yes gene_type:complete